MFGINTRGILNVCIVFLKKTHERKYVKKIINLPILNPTPTSPLPPICRKEEGEGEGKGFHYDVFFLFFKIYPVHINFFICFYLKCT